jgi:SAM-dependent methyltransferase
MSNYQTNPVLEFYQDADQTRQPKGTGTARSRVSQLVPLLEPHHSAYFLDIGCYNGTKTHYIARFVQAECVVGTDFLYHQLRQAQAYNVHTLIADLNAGLPLPFGDETFDFIFVGDVIEHIFSPDYLLQEIARLLRQGGYALLTTPNLASWRNRLVLLLGWQPFATEVSTRYRVGNPLMPGGIPSGHIRVFTPRALRELSQAYNLDVEYLGGVGLPGAKAGWISILAAMLDQVLLRLHSTLADELVIKLRKRQQP